MTSVLRSCARRGGSGRHRRRGCHPLLRRNELVSIVAFYCGQRDNSEGCIEVWESNGRRAGARRRLLRGPREVRGGEPSAQVLARCGPTGAGVPARTAEDHRRHQEEQLVPPGRGCARERRGVRAGPADLVRRRDPARHPVSLGRVDAARARVRDLGARRGRPARPRAGVLCAGPRRLRRVAPRPGRRAGRRPAGSRLRDRLAVCGQHRTRAYPRSTRACAGTAGGGRPDPRRGSLRAVVAMFI